MTEAIHKKNKNITVIGASESTSKLNESNLVKEFSQFLYDFEHSGIPNVSTLKEIGVKLGIDAILQGTFSEVVQNDCQVQGLVGIPNMTSLTLRYTLLSTSNGSTLWEGTSNARKSGGRCEAWPLYEVIDLSQKKILTGMPTFGNY